MSKEPPTAQVGTSRMPTRQRGFTLLELIVAVSVLALIAVFSWRGLDAVLRTRDSLNVAQARLDALQRSFNRIEHDAMIATGVDLERGGRFRLIASNDISVEYRLDGDSLSRRVVTPGTGSADPAETSMLISDIRVLKAEVFTHAVASPIGGVAGSTAQGASGWTSRTAETTDGPTTEPPAGAPAAGTPASPFAQIAPSLATGLRVTLTVRNGGDVQRVFLVGSAS